jgi:hypothetical protein
MPSSVLQRGTIDMTYPIILGYDGRVMDGVHRPRRQVGQPIQKPFRWDTPSTRRQLGHTHANAVP